MIETGRIVAIKNRLVTVRLASAGSADSAGYCFGCMNQECKKKENSVSAVNSLGLPLKTGQSIRIEFRNASLAAQGLQAALPPLLGFVAGFTGAGFLFPAQGEGIRILGGLIIMAAAGAAFYTLRRKRPAKTLPKVIGTAIDDQETPAAASP